MDVLNPAEAMKRRHPKAARRRRILKKWNNRYKSAALMSKIADILIQSNPLFDDIEPIPDWSVVRFSLPKVFRTQGEVDWIRAEKMESENSKNEFNNRIRGKWDKDV
jgi:hypothetical protein